MCSLVEMGALISTATLFSWPLDKLDFKSASLQTGSAARDVCVIPLRHSGHRGKVLWLFLTAAYGLFNASSKWQARSDELLLAICLESASMIPQLFMRRSNVHVISLDAKTVEEFRVTGLEHIFHRIIEKINGRFLLGIGVHGPDPIRFFVIKLFHQEDMAVEFNADDKLNGIAIMKIARVRSGETDSPIN